MTCTLSLMCGQNKMKILTGLLPPHYPFIPSHHSYLVPCMTRWFIGTQTWTGHTRYPSPTQVMVQGCTIHLSFFAYRSILQTISRNVWRKGKNSPQTHRFSLKFLLLYCCKKKVMKSFDISQECQPRCEMQKQ